jgi:DNA repair exonuclease SbcCD ATPase subunit
MDAALDQLPDDPVLLKAIIAEQMALRVQMEASVKAYEALVQALKVRIARLRRQKFGPSSEKIEREIEQLELALEALEVKMAGDDTRPDLEETAEVEAAPTTVPAPRRRGKPRISKDAPRERHVLDPGEACPECGGVLRMLGEDASEILDARGSSRTRRRPGLCRAVWLGPDCWLIFWSRSTTITCLSIVRARSSPASGRIFHARR